MENKLIFEGLKFNTSFNFKNRRQKTKYFNDLLFESSYLFQQRQKQYFSERMHVIFSFEKVCKWLAIMFGSISILAIHTSFGYVTCLLMVLFGVMTLIYNRKFQNLMFRYSFSLQFYEDEELLSMMKDEINLGTKIIY